MAEFQPQLDATGVATGARDAAARLDLGSLIARLEDLRPQVTLPISRVPLLPGVKADASTREVYELQVEALARFFHALHNGPDDNVPALVAPGIVSPDFVTPSGETPLLEAVRLGKVALVRRLLTLGAAVDHPGRILPPPKGKPMRPERTPLQLAASLGNLALVRLLIEEYKADDALVAPDGALAVRLAAKNGHDDVVAYLPPRHNGKLRRLKEKLRVVAKHAAAVIVLFVMIIPRKVLYDGPKAVFGGKLRLGERLGQMWDVITHILVLVCVGIYEVPKEASKSVWKRIKGDQQKS